MTRRKAPLLPSIPRDTPKQVRRRVCRSSCIHSRSFGLLAGHKNHHVHLLRLQRPPMLPQRIPRLDNTDSVFSSRQATPGPGFGSMPSAVKFLRQPPALCKERQRSTDPRRANRVCETLEPPVHLHYAGTEKNRTPANANRIRSVAYTARITGNLDKPTTIFTFSAWTFQTSSVLTNDAFLRASLTAQEHEN